MVFSNSPGKTGNVQEIDIKGAEDFTGSPLARKPDNTPPPVPEYDVVSSFGGLTLQITNYNSQVPDLDTFILYAASSLNADGTPLGAAELARSPTTTITKVFDRGAVGTTVYVALTAIDLAGNESDYGDWLSVVILDPEGAEDNFSTYGGNVQTDNDSELYFIQISCFEPDENWSGSPTFGTTHVVQGSNSVTLDITSTDSEDPGFDPGVSLLPNPDLDIDGEGRFTDDDYLTYSYYISALSGSGDVNINIRFIDLGSGGYIQLAHTNSAPAVGWTHVKILRSDATTSGSPDLTAIDAVSITAFPSDTRLATIHIDDLRTVKASALDATTHSDTGDVWQPYPDDNKGSSVGEWHIYSDVPGHRFAMGQIETDSGTEKILLRDDIDIAYKSLETANHLADFLLKEDGYVGLLTRIQKPPNIVESSVLNVIFTNNSAHPLGRTHTPTESGVAYGQTSNLGTYANFADVSDSLSYADVALNNTRDELTVYCAFSPDWAYDDGGDNKTIFHHRIDANNIMLLRYNTTVDAWRVFTTIGGVSQTTLQSATQNFDADTNMTIAVSVDNTALSLYINGVLEDTITLTTSYSTSDGALHLSNNSGATDDYTGLMYQFLVCGEIITDDEALRWHNALFSAMDKGFKVGNLGSRSYYKFSVDSSLNQVRLRKVLYGYYEAALQTAVSVTLNTDTVYYVAVRTENRQSAVPNGPFDRVSIKAYITDNQARVVDGDSQMFAVTDSDDPLLAGTDGFVTDTNARIAAWRAGSPDHAQSAEVAKRADVALGISLDWQDMILESAYANIGSTVAAAQYAIVGDVLKIKFGVTSSAAAWASNATIATLPVAIAETFPIIVRGASGSLVRVDIQPDGDIVYVSVISGSDTAGQLVTNGIVSVSLV